MKYIKKVYPWELESYRNVIILVRKKRTKMGRREEAVRRELLK